MNEKTVEYFEYLADKRRQKYDMNYLTKDLKTIYSSHDDTWFYPLINRSDYSDIILSLLKNHDQFNWLQPENKPQIESLEIKYHEKLGPILWVRYNYTIDNKVYRGSRLFGETSNIQLLGTHINGHESEMYDLFNPKDFQSGVHTLGTDFVHIMSILNKGRRINGKTYDEVFTDRFVKYSKFQELEEIENKEEEFENLKKKFNKDIQVIRQQHIDRLKNFTPNIEQHNKEFNERYNDLFNKPTM